MPHKDEDQLRTEIKTLLNTDNAPRMPEEVSESIRSTILGAEALVPGQRVHFLRTTGFRYAAAVVLMVGAAAWYFFSKTPDKAGQEKRELAKGDVQPGKSGAVLTLADGRTIVLDSLTNGIIASEGGTQVVLTGGQLAYNATQTSISGRNTMTTPNGRMFQLLLPDGSRAWLNAASSITYPTAFTGKERKVTIKGEVYFEIAPNPDAPFSVVAGGTAINVLGTSFNVMAYEDEQHTKTTLLEGKIRVAQGTHTATLLPGQGAVTSGSGEDGGITVETMDTEQAVAWKNGQFAFKNSSLPEVMRQIARWYNISVEFDGSIPGNNITGNISRNYKLSEVLKMLEFTAGIHYVLEGNKLLLQR